MSADPFDLNDELHGFEPVGHTDLLTPQPATETEQQQRYDDDDREDMEGEKGDVYVDNAGVVAEENDDDYNGFVEDGSKAAAEEIDIQGVGFVDTDLDLLGSTANHQPEPVAPAAQQDLLLEFENPESFTKMEDHDLTPTAPEPSYNNEPEVSPPPSPPPSPVTIKTQEAEPVTPTPEREPLDIGTVSSDMLLGSIADSTTPSSDDRPVKMPKATTIAPPSKTAPASAKSCNSFSSGCMSAWLKRLDPRVWDILMWRDPRVTGPVLAAIMLVMFSLACYSIFSVVSYTLLLTLTLTLGIRVVKYIAFKVHKGDDSHPFKDVLDADITLSEEMVEDYTQAAVQQLNAFVSDLRDLILVKDIVASVKLGLVLYAMTYIGAWFNGLTVMILAIAAAFTIPKCYEVNKVKIDQYVDMAQSKFDDYYKLLQDKVPYLKKQKTL